MNLIHQKRLKRKRILEGRMKCHGNTYRCSRIHYNSSQVKELKKRQQEEWARKQKAKEPTDDRGWIKRLLGWKKKHVYP